MTIDTVNGCVVLSHPPDWSTKPSGKRVWETEIATSVKGAEARSAMRAVPRRQLTYMITPCSLQERVRLEARLDAASKSGFACGPLHGRACTLAAAAAANGNTLTVNAGAWNWQAGDYAILISDDQTFDVAAIVNVAGNVLTLAANLNFAWPAQTLCWPVIFGAFSSEKETALDGHHAVVKVTIAELTSGRTVQVGATPNPKLGIGQMQVGQNFTVGGKQT